MTEHFGGFLRGGVPRRYVRMGERSWARASRATAVSTHLRQRMVDTPGVARVALTPNPVAEDLVPEAVARTGEGITRWLALGRLVPQKGFRQLLAAFARAFGGRTDVELAIGGQGPLRGELGRLAEAWGLAGQVRFLGALDRAQVGEALARTDFFVHASHWETFGVVMLEALAAGVPVVAVDSGGPRDFLTRERGRLVPPGNAHALAEAMATMEAERAGWDEARPAIRRAILGEYGRSAVAARYGEIYAPLLAGGPRRAAS